MTEELRTQQAVKFKIWYELVTRTVIYVIYLFAKYLGTNITAAPRV